jgi:hypothetical protein
MPERSAYMKYLDERFANLHTRLDGFEHHLEHIDRRLDDGGEWVMELKAAVEIIKSSTCPLHTKMEQIVEGNARDILVNKTKQKSTWLTLTVLGSLIVSMFALVIAILSIVEKVKGLAWVVDTIQNLV